MDPIQISKLLADKYSIKILSATYKKAKSANYLSMKLDIPIAACYRRIRNLEKIGLLKEEDKVLTKFGKWVKIYRSSLKYANVVLDNGKMKVYLQLADSENPEEMESWEVLENEG